MIHPILKGRFLFIVDNCIKCDIYEEFIEEINSELKPEKRIEVMNLSNYHDYGIIDDLRMLSFLPYIKKSGFIEYPILFIDGSRKDYINSRVEAEAWVRARVHEDFLSYQYNPYMFNKECQFGKRGILKRKIICNV